MLFDTLDGAIADIDSLQDYNLDHLIKHYGISFQYSSNLPNRVYGFSLPYTNTMFINANTEYPERIKAHELIHCLVDDSAEPLIESSFSSNAKIESRADRGGLYLMIHEWLAFTGIESQDFNIETFCVQNHIPRKYVFMAAGVAEQALDVKIPKLKLYY
ncbi:hypothetical protein [Levilactobacillus brevis]|uniref:hypothetical protein n=1 Tax=Levilactobacillus brevis TaxID=1580 RepID=UPI000B3E838B|nr:hypothetical protein [Levilactobacillus brevis]ARW21822.1 hypothetical protein S101174_00979 [Levilactobacillus brevis]